MNAGVLKTVVADGIATVTLGSANRIYFDVEMSDALTAAVEELAGDTKVRVVIVTGGAPGYFIRHYSIPALIDFAEAVRASRREWPDNATYHGGFIDKAMAYCETMPKPVIAAISGTALAGGFEFALSCDLRIAEDGDYLIGLPERKSGFILPRVARRGCRVQSGRPHQSDIGSSSIARLIATSDSPVWPVAPLRKAIPRYATEEFALISSAFRRCSSAACQSQS